MQEKTCKSCGRRIEPRRKWKDNFDEIVYCGERCRRNKPGKRGAAIEAAILALLQQRGQGDTICPSEVARAHWDDWREHMETVRQAARRLVAAGRIEITQGGVVVDPSSAKGPIRLRLKR